MTIRALLASACVGVFSLGVGSACQPPDEGDDLLTEESTSAVKACGGGRGAGDLFLNPFDKQSAHHRPIGTGAVYGILKGTKRTRGRLDAIEVDKVALAPPEGTKYLNRVAASDPLTTVSYNSSHSGGNPALFPTTVRIPRDADLPPASSDSDNVVLFFPHNGDCASEVADSFFGFFVDGAGKRRASSRKAYSLRGTDVGGGTSASRIKFPSGVMRGFELANRTPIRHALQVAVSRKDGNPDFHILSKAFRWPAEGTDGNADDVDKNRGDIAYGTRVAIRPSDASPARRRELNLSEIGNILFDAHLYYGVLVVDGTGTNATGAKWNYRRDQDIPAALEAEVERELRKIVPLLWPIDNTKENEAFAGGGTSLGGINTAWNAD